MTQKNDFLNRLYMACSMERGDWTFAEGLGLNLGEFYRRDPEINACSRKLSDALHKVQMSGEDLVRIDTLCVESSIANERQGFINGFRLGLKLAIEAISTPLAAEPEARG